MSLLAASTAEPSVVLRQRSNAIKSLDPLLNLVHRFQQLLSSTTLVLLIRTLFAARVIGTAFLLASRAAVLRMLLTSRILTLKTVCLAKHFLWTVWDSRRTRRLRRKLQFELFIMMLGPGGNILCLILFWPGWLLLAAASGALWLGVKMVAT